MVCRCLGRVRSLRWPFSRTFPLWQDATSPWKWIWYIYASFNSHFHLTLTIQYISNVFAYHLFLIYSLEIKDFSNLLTQVLSIIVEINKKSILCLGKKIHTTISNIIFHFLKASPISMRRAKETRRQLLRDTSLQLSVHETNVGLRYI